MLPSLLKTSRKGTVFEAKQHEQGRESPWKAAFYICRHGATLSLLRVAVNNNLWSAATRGGREITVEYNFLYIVTVQRFLLGFRFVSWKEKKKWKVKRRPTDDAASPPWPSSPPGSPRRNFSGWGRVITPLLPSCLRSSTLRVSLPFPSLQAYSVLYVLIFLFSNTLKLFYSFPSLKKYLHCTSSVVLFFHSSFFLSRQAYSLL